MNPKQRVRAAIAGEPLDRIPVSTWGHDFLREWSAADLADHTVERQRECGYDFVKLNPRWTMFAEPWGNRYERPTEQKFPRLTHRVIDGPEDFDAITPVNAGHPVFVEYEQALTGVLERIGEKVDVIATLFSPLATVGLLCGGLGQPLIGHAQGNEAVLESCLARVTESLSAHATRLINLGASGLFYAPLQWTSTDVCPPEFYERFGRPHDLEVLGSVQDAGFNMLHICGDHIEIDRFLDYPVEVFNWDNFGAGNPSLIDVHGRTDKVVSGGIPHRQVHNLTMAELLEAARGATAGLDTRVMLTGGCAVGALLEMSRRVELAELPARLAAA